MATFKEWFDSSWKRDGEALTPALTRLAAGTGCTLKTLKFAYRGCACRKETAAAIVQASAGAVDHLSLLTGPSRTELTGRASEPEQGAA